MDPVRFALIGCGRMGTTADDVAARWNSADLWIPLSHASAIQASPGCTLVAVCDIDPGRANAAASRYGLAEGFSTNYREMLEATRPEAVCIATRTQERVKIIRACVDAGVRGIFCEKPLSHTLEEADEIHSLVSQAGIPFVFGTRRRFMPVYQRARRDFWSGMVGDPHSILLEFGLATLLWTHPHTVDLASFMANDMPLETVEARLDYPGESWSENTLDCDPHVLHATLTFQNHLTAHILRSGGLDVVLCGSKGKIIVASDGLRTRVRLEDDRPGRVDGGMFGRSLDIPTPKECSGTMQSMALLARAIRGDMSGLPPADCFLKNTEMLFGLAESGIRSGASVSIPLPRRGLRITGRIGALHP